MFIHVYTNVFMHVKLMFTLKDIVLRNLLHTFVLVTYKMVLKFIKMFYWGRWRVPEMRHLAP